MARSGPRTQLTGVNRPSVSPHIRCAIYTRKSTEDGLDQEFNGLDAQYEACAAYALSQRHEGWTLVPDRYDDGGYSGGNMQRPGLQRSLADIAASRVDIILVYKIDRLTRALSDFAKIVEVLDKADANFVSITQSFNTTTSMGRLTLNMLLSFAQFEREVTGERIRDKIAASKRKGLWMGGPVPLGYNVCDRELVVNEEEAAMVRLIFERHQAVGALQALAAELRRCDIVSKQRVMRDGRVIGGQPFSAGALRYLLGNRIYVGEIRHGDNVYPGKHQPIIAREGWEASQRLLARNVPRPRSGQVSLLNGLLHDSHGRKMTSAHAIRSNRRYRYYVSRPTADIAIKPWRIPAGDIEALVRRTLGEFLGSPERIIAALGYAAISLSDITSRCRILIIELEGPAICSSLLQALQTNIMVEQDCLAITVSGPALSDRLDSPNHGIADEHRITIRAEAVLRRRGHELRLVQPTNAQPAQPDNRLIQLLAAGRAAWRELQQHRPADAARRSHLTRLARLAFLAPDIVTAILEGRQPVEMTSRSLLRMAELPIAWTEQRRVLGFG